MTSADYDYSGVLPPATKGHRRKSVIYTLTFDDSHGEELAGLIIRCRGASHKHLFMIAKLGGVDLTQLMETGIDALNEICESFPSRIIDWNHEDEDGRPIPAIAEYFLDEDYTFTIPIVSAWVNTIRANPKSAATISSMKQSFAEEEAPDDLSDLPMTITN